MLMRARERPDERAPDEPVPNAADMLAQQHGTELLQPRRRVVERLDDRLATEALAAGVSTFELSRVMGTSIQMIDRITGTWLVSRKSRFGLVSTPDPLNLAIIWRRSELGDYSRPRSRM